MTSRLPYSKLIKWWQPRRCVLHFKPAIKCNISKRLYSSITDNSIYTNNCVRTITSCYQRKLEQSRLYFENQSRDILSAPHFENDVHHLILTARPDEFEKLPPKCSACGVILQNKNENQEGYIPEAKLFNSMKEDTLHKVSCYKCYRLRYHNEGSCIPLDKDSVVEQLHHLRQRKALVLYVVDLFDIEGTQFPKLLQVIGKRKRMIIVGNKLDRLPQDDKKPVVQLERTKDILKNICYQNGLAGCNFRDICLVSARTGYGLQTLVEKISKHREVDMDIYLVGCANSGKSTLYNSLVNLLNVHKVEELPSQAIEHHTPGSTNSLVRHNISLRRLLRLKKRLNDGPWEEEDREYDFDQEILDLVGYKEEQQPIKKKRRERILLKDPRNSVQSSQLEFIDLNEKKERLCHIYDTPGILNDSQILRHLTPKEINYLSPTRWIIPRSVVLKPGHSIFIGGLARLDYLQIKRMSQDVEKEEIEDDLVRSAESIYVTVMVSPNVPIHVSYFGHLDEGFDAAGEKFKKLFIDNVLELPEGSKGRFEQYPPLIPQEYVIIGKNRNINACDLALHGVGWLSVAAVLDSRVHLSLHTPNGDGQNLRNEPLLPYSVRKKDGRGVTYRGHINRFMYGHTRKRSPQFIRVFQAQNDAVYSWKAKINQKMKLDRNQEKEERRLKRLEDGVVLGRMKNLLEKERKHKKLEHERYLQLKGKSL